MSHTQNLINSMEEVKKENLKYYKELVSDYSKYFEFDICSLDEYIKQIFISTKRNYFTVCSKESFNNLEANKNWLPAMIYTPLNDHSRPFMKKGDIVFCYRQGQFSELNEALQMRGIYGLGFVASAPQELYPQKDGHNKYGVAILFPYSLQNHLELRNIQLNPITISLTPYNGNRNDALQYIQDSKYYNCLIEQIAKKNPSIKNSLEVILRHKINNIELGDEKWKINFSNKSAASAQHSSQIQHKQLILYGVPGCGKSYAVAKKLAELDISQENTPFYTKRVVFHPEYTNADFVGQILPRADSDGNRISYPFVAGPFTQLLALAYTHKDKNFALIIEEINRGNAAAIFGELFQLLDRLEQDEGGSSNGYSYTAGWSSYPVANDSINRAVYEAYSQYAGDSDFAPFIPKENFERYKENIGIRLPPNFSIFATMNTSDQNVFKLDNAFKRRFDLELIPNTFDDENKNLADEEKILVKNQRDAQVEGFDFTWNEFREAVNEIIASPENSFDSSSFADRQIGCWFAKAEEKNGTDTDIKSELKISKKTFVNKVLEYLWDDACGGESELFFSPQYKTLAELARAVEKNGEKTIFSSDLQAKIDLRKNAER